MADVAETPQTVPKDRMRYTVEAETAWSDKQHMSVLSRSFFEAVDLPAWSNDANEVNKIAG